MYLVYPNLFSDKNLVSKPSNKVEAEVHVRFGDYGNASSPGGITGDHAAGATRRSRLRRCLRSSQTPTWTSRLVHLKRFKNEIKIFVLVATKRIFRPRAAIRYTLVHPPFFSAFLTFLAYTICIRSAQKLRTFNGQSHAHFL